MPGPKTSGKVTMTVRGSGAVTVRGCPATRIELANTLWDASS